MQRIPLKQRIFFVDKQYESRTVGTDWKGLFFAYKNVEKVSDKIHLNFAAVLEQALVFSFSNGYHVK